MEKPEEQQKTDATSSEVAAETQEASQDDSEFDVSEEEIELDEPSDTEDYKPPVKKTEEAEKEDLDDDDDEDISSGEEEEGVHIQEVAVGKVKYVKLAFDDVEEKRKEFIHKLETEESESEDEEQAKNKENVENNSQEKSSAENQQVPKAKFSDYRQLLDEDMDEYNSDDDDNFNPVYCGETLSDVEYNEDDERNTESEPEIEEQECHEMHKRTGEPLICIRMMEQLDLPPDCAMAAVSAASPDAASPGAMECA
uniref:Uncharacterized protein C1orf109 homolog n=1 Tax=Phallusia mammillata TaxID=59560 RepID=A0A6F9D8J2_9ASCI|nr:uncharacterized protein C1orf109 homolog [Phallusia mammillata]